MQGAAMDLSRLPGESAGASSFLPASVVTNTMRIGWVFMVEGAHFTTS